MFNNQIIPGYNSYIEAVMRRYELQLTNSINIKLKKIKIKKVKERRQKDIKSRKAGIKQKLRNKS